MNNIKEEFPYASSCFTGRIWPDFCKTLKHKNSLCVYKSDLNEIMSFHKKDFIDLTNQDTTEYYQYQRERVTSEEIQPNTLSKKIHEMHSVSSFIKIRQEYYNLPYYQNVFEHILPLLEKQEEYVKSISIEDLDKLLQAASCNLMEYCILTFICRVGLTSKEIADLCLDQFCEYDNGVYIFFPKRRSPCYVPEDALYIFMQYLSTQSSYENSHVFLNSRKNPLNTMYISRMIKSLCIKAGISPVSARTLRNSCAVSMYSYHADPDKIAEQMGITTIHIKRYKKAVYKAQLMKANELVKIKVLPPR